MSKNAGLQTAEISHIWELGGTICGIKAYGAGHINTTNCVTVKTADGETRRYILQAINTAVFTDPDGLMENIWNVTEYLRHQAVLRRDDPDRATMQVIPTKTGAKYYRDATGVCWRIYTFVERTYCLQQVRIPQDFYESGFAFGMFQKQLADYPAETLHETIPHFHDTPKRYETLEHAAKIDAFDRAKSVKEELEFLRARKDDCGYLKQLLEQGKLPLRVTHNDTKLNNILFDETTGKGQCIIDLDTVMPGLAAHDFGDSIRFGANHCAEDEPDLSKVNFSLDLYESYAKGYLEAAGDALTKLERETLPWGAKVMTLENAIRFLTDYLEGDHYFHTSREGQNLDRARTQMKLVQGMEEKWREMRIPEERYINMSNE